MSDETPAHETPALDEEGAPAADTADRSTARSATMTAMDVPDDIAAGAMRLSVGRFTTTDEIDSAIEQLIKAAK